MCVFVNDPSSTGTGIEVGGVSVGRIAFTGFGDEPAACAWRGALSFRSGVVVRHSTAQGRARDVGDASQPPKFCVAYSVEPDVADPMPILVYAADRMLARCDGDAIHASYIWRAVIDVGPRRMFSPSVRYPE